MKDQDKSKSFTAMSIISLIVLLAADCVLPFNTLHCQEMMLAELMTRPICIAVTVKDYRKQYNAANRYLALLPLIPYGRRESAGSPFIKGQIGDTVLDYKYVFPLLLTKEIRKSKAVKHVCFESESKFLSQYELILEMDLHDLYMSDNLYLYGLSALGLYLYILGLPAVKVGLYIDIDWRLYEQNSNRILKNGSITENTSRMVGLYYGASGPPLVPNAKATLQMGVFDRVIGDMVKEIEEALKSREPSYWNELATKHERWRISQGEVLAYRPKESVPVSVIAEIHKQEKASEQTRITAIGESWAVVIGISKYNDSRIPALRYADRDAQAFYDWLVDQEGGKHSPQRMKLLLNEQATARNIRKALFEWLKGAIAEDLVIIYLAGHGTPESPGNLDNLFFIPYDADYGSIASTGFPMWDIETALKRFISAKRVVVFADACHAAGVGKSWEVTMRDINRDLMIKKLHEGLQNLSQVSEGIAIITASSEAQVSQEGEQWGGGHGVFTHFLLQGLKGEADYNKNAKVELGELVPYLSDKVRRATKNEQCPQVAGRYDPSLTITAQHNPREK